MGTIIQSGIYLTACSKKFLIFSSVDSSFSPKFILTPIPENSTTLSASWTMPYNPFDYFDMENYVIEIVCNESLTFEVPAAPDSETITFILTGLTPFTVYKCSVFATSNNGSEKVSNSSIAMTGEDGTSRTLIILFS